MLNIGWTKLEQFKNVLNYLFSCEPGGKVKNELLYGREERRFIPYEIVSYRLIS